MKTALLYLLVPVLLIGCGDTSTLPVNQPPDQTAPDNPTYERPVRVHDS